MVTPLKPHHGQHGGLVALGLLVASSAVVWFSHPREAAHAVGSEPAPAPAAVAPTPAAAVPVVVPASAAEPAAPIAIRELPARVTGTGVVTYDEARTARVSLGVHGWLQKTRAASLGRRVRAGEVLGVVYSAEVYLATADLVKQVREFESQDELNKARFRLLAWGMPRQTLDRIEKTLQPQAALPIVARLPGTIIAEQGPVRGLVDPYAGRELFTITDPSYAYAFVDVGEREASYVRVGAPARIEIEGLAHPLVAKVAYVWRRSEDRMRKVRLDVRAPRVAKLASATVRAELRLERVRDAALPTR